MTSPARSVALPLRHPRQPDLRVIGHRDAVAVRPGPPIGAWLMLAVVVVGAFFVLIYSRITLDQAAFELDILESRIAAEEAAYWELRLEVTELQAPERIRDLAEEMGMVYPARVETIEVPALGTPVRDVEDRWADLKALLGAQP